MEGALAEMWKCERRGRGNVSTWVGLGNERQRGKKEKTGPRVRPYVGK